MFFKVYHERDGEAGKANKDKENDAKVGKNTVKEIDLESQYMIDPIMDKIIITCTEKDKLEEEA